MNVDILLKSYCLFLVDLPTYAGTSARLREPITPSPSSSRWVWVYVGWLLDRTTAVAR